MKNSAIFFFIIGVMVATASLGVTSQRMDTAATMAIADKNGDSRIDREEYHQRMTDVFFFADMDKDGNLTITEIRLVEDVDPQAFNAADRDGNQSLSIYEYHYVLHKDFDVADRNSDGTIDMEELDLLVSK
jgi:Ca2+-binding EF-hand superfamily protein